MDEPKQQTVFDSDQQLIGETYANALIGFGQKSGNTETLLNQFNGVADAISSLPKLDAMLQSPRIGVADKLQLIEKALAAKVDGKLMNFLKIILEKGRFNCVPVIQTAAQKIFDEMSGRVQATMTTAEDVDDSVRKRVEEKLANMLGKEIQLQSKTDPSIIGGMVVRIGDTVYDGSVRNQLDQVRNRATKRAEESIRSSIEKFMAT